MKIRVLVRKKTRNPERKSGLRVTINKRIIMSNHKDVKPDDEIILSKSVRVPGERLASLTEFPKDMFVVPLRELFSPAFGSMNRNPKDYYFLPGRHEEHIYRYKIIDAQFDHKDEFKFCLIPLDIDMRSESGREQWDDKKQAQNCIDQMVKRVPLLKYASAICSSRGGIRVVFTTNKYVNALEWRHIYASVVGEVANSLQGSFIDRGKLEFTIDKVLFTLDPRNPGSLTRIPYGFRSGQEVRKSEYFYMRDIKGFPQLPIEHLGPLAEMELVRSERKGYSTINLPLPRPTILEDLPEWIKPYEWPEGEPPQEGSRELTIFTMVARAKYRYTDRLSPSQYFTYFYDAIKQMKAMDDMDILDLLWSKITRNYYVRSDADTFHGKRHDTQQLNNSGGVAFYPATEFDDVLMPFEVYRYAKKEQKNMIKDLLRMEHGTVFLNPPPGAGKSTAAVTLLEKRGGIYIAPSNKQINDIMKRIQCDTNIVLSYKELIKVVCDDKQAIDILTAKYDMEYSPRYESASMAVTLLMQDDPYAHFDPSMMVRRGNFYKVKSFPEFIRQQFPIQADRMRRENESRIGLLERGELSLLTKDKFMTLMHRQTTLSLPDNHLIIYDEAEPEDVIDPQIYASSAPVKVYGKTYEPRLTVDYTSQINFIEFLKRRPTVFINANRGLDKALTHNGFQDVTVMGADMKNILDLDLHIVLSPDLKAGYSPHKNLEDDVEISPRALYAKQVNRKTYTLMTNGRDIEGVPLASRDNLKRVIGSNDYINSRVISIITSPTPEQVAELTFCTGMRTDNAKILIFQNLVNQIVSRNVGYRGFKTINEVRQKDFNQVKALHNNEHILVLPHTTLNEDLDLIVKTPNVWTVKSTKPPTAVSPYIRLLPLTVKVRAELYAVEPGSFTTLDELAKSTDNLATKISFVLKDLKQDPMLADFELVKRTRIHGVHLRNVIKRFETLPEIVESCIAKINNGYRFTDFIKLLGKETSERYIKALTSRDLKTYIRQESFRFDYRVIKIRNIDYLVRTGAEEYFEPLTLSKPAV